MTLQSCPDDLTPDAATLSREARRILRRLCETGAVLAVAADMEKAVVVRDGADGSSTRTAVVPTATIFLPSAFARFNLSAVPSDKLNHSLCI